MATLADNSEPAQASDTHAGSKANHADGISNARQEGLNINSIEVESLRIAELLDDPSVDDPRLRYTQRQLEVAVAKAESDRHKAKAKDAFATSVGVLFFAIILGAFYGVGYLIAKFPVSFIFGMVCIWCGYRAQQ